MAEKYFPFRSVSGDRKYSAEDWAAYFALFLSNGVFYSSVDKLKVAANEGMKVKVGKGAAFIAGRMYMLETDKIITLDTADGVLNRIDRIVLRCDYTSRKITTEVVKGSYGERPTAPALNRNSDVYELALADVYVAAGVISITQANITDQRLNTSLCGIVTGLVDQADTEEIFNQFTAYLEEFKAASQAEFEGQQDAWEEEFNTWFGEIKTVLEGDVAASLAKRLLELENGTTPAGKALEADNAQTLDGHRAEYFVNMGEGLGTSITEKAITLANGVHFYQLGGSYYTGNDLPTSNYAWSYSNAMVLKRNNGSLEIVLFSEKVGRIAIKSYDGSWNEWSEYATTIDLANYLSRAGGNLKANAVINGKLNTAYSAPGFFVHKANSDEICGGFGVYSSPTENGEGKHVFIGFSDLPYVDTNGLAIGANYIRWKRADLLHSGNYFEYAMRNKAASADTANITENGIYADTASLATVLHAQYDVNAGFQFRALAAFPNKPQYRGKSGGNWQPWYDLLHTGNSAKVVINESAPADTSALWVY